MSRRGSCYDSAVAETFFNLLNIELISRETNKTPKDARQDVFDYIGLLYNSIGRDADNGML